MSIGIRVDCIIVVTVRVPSLFTWNPRRVISCRVEWAFVSLCLMCLYTGSLPGLVIAPRYVAFVFCSKCFSIGQIAISAFSCSCCFFVRSIVDFFRLTISPSFLHLLMIVVMIFVSPANGLGH